MINNKKHTIFFDIDGTIYDKDYVSPKLLPTLWKLRDLGYSLGISTSQSLKELKIFLHEKLLLPHKEVDLFNAGYILEDGHVYIDSIQVFLDKDYSRILTSEAALMEMQLIKGEFLNIWHENLQSKDNGWKDGYIGDFLEFPVYLYPFTKGSITIWEKGPDIVDDPSYIEKYARFYNWMNKFINTLNIKNVKLIEIGNGTLRILDMNLDKGLVFVKLKYDLSRIIYVGNGINDIPAAKIVKSKGGLVWVVTNSPQELKDLATAISSMPASDGVLELIEKNLYY